MKTGKTIALLGVLIYIFSCSGEHATEEESATTDSSAVVKVDSIKGDTAFIEEDVSRP
jgi:hypothetical protein